MISLFSNVELARNIGITFKQYGHLTKTVPPCFLYLLLCIWIVQNTLIRLYQFILKIVDGFHCGVKTVPATVRQKKGAGLTVRTRLSFSDNISELTLWLWKEIHSSCRQTTASRSSYWNAQSHLSKQRQKTQHSRETRKLADSAQRRHNMELLTLQTNLCNCRLNSL